MAEDRLKYLDFLQSTISRMASNSFLVKGWSVALGTAVLGFSVKESSWALALIAAIPVASFWTLDAYYLGLERRFRQLWEDAVGDKVDLFNMNPGVLDPELWIEAAWRPAVWLVHLPIFVASLLVSAALAVISLMK